MPRLRELLALTGTERRLLFAAFACLLAARLLLPVADVDRARRVVRMLSGLVPPYLTVPDAERIPWAVAVVDRQFPGSRSCLMRAITCETLLRSHGYPATIHLGVTKDDDFSAHAWVERDDEVVIGDSVDLEQYQRLETLDYGC